ncbi:TetR-like C-terminal domain-containing protein [Streptomyces sp. MJM1172]|uniref:TetR-like C-terminal domain-containing protein n=1 Tax=Streptomyces sp. MJM1172 TaxID=1703926 RepID=UPI001F52AD98|nr:TetR-like C-terminal domain-containing protein [Streptomyces sp. MJM1172]
MITRIAADARLWFSASRKAASSPAVIVAQSGSPHRGCCRNPPLLADGCRAPRSPLMPSPPRIGIVPLLLDALGPAPLEEGADRAELMSSMIRWIAAKIAEPGVGDAFAGVFIDAVSDPAPREILSTGLQDPYRLALQDALDEPENRVLFFIDVAVGTLLHRMGMTGEPMADADVDALVAMMLPHFASGASPA